MNEERENQQDQSSNLLAAITIDAAPPQFTSQQIATQYWRGNFQSRLDAELHDILASCTPPTTETEARPISLTDTDTLKRLNSIVLIQGGDVLPLLDIEQMSFPLTQGQKIRLYNETAKTLLAAIQVILEDHIAHKNDDDEPGVPCYE